MKKINLKGSLPEQTDLYELAVLIAAVTQKMGRTNITDEYVNLKKQLAEYKGHYETYSTEWARVESIDNWGRKSSTDYSNLKASAEMFLNKQITEYKTWDDNAINMQINSSTRKLELKTTKSIEDEVKDGIRKGIEAGLPQAVEAEMRRRQRLQDLKQEEEQLLKESEISEEDQAKIDAHTSRKQQLDRVREELKNL